MTENNLGKHAGLHPLNWISHSHNAAAIANLLCLSSPLVPGRKKKHIHNSQAPKHVKSVSFTDRRE